MTAGFRVIAPGLGTTVQDAGRIGHRQSGVPSSGPLDRIAFRIANALARNAAGTPALEMLMFGATLEVLANSVRVAVAGGVATVTVITEHGERQMPAHTSMRLRRGDRLKLGTLDQALSGYLAVEGGFVVPAVLGSASTYTRSTFGGVEGRILRQGDVLAIAQDDASDSRDLMLPRARENGFEQPIRVVAGPQDDYFTDAAMALLLSADYVVSPQSDRMGFRLEGPALEHAKGYNIVSDGIVSGAIQVPGDGKPIVLMVDAQTAGGYPKIATVISADIPLLAQRKPGRSVRFAAVTREEAEAIRRTQESELNHLLANLREVADVASIDIAALHDANLIGGVVNGLE